MLSVVSSRIRATAGAAPRSSLRASAAGFNLHWKRQVARITPPRQAQLIVVVVNRYESRIILPRQAHCFDFAMSSFLAGCHFIAPPAAIPPDILGGTSKNGRDHASWVLRVFAALNELDPSGPQPTHNPPAGTKQKKEAACFLNYSDCWFLSNESQ